MWSKMAAIAFRPAPHALYAFRFQGSYTLVPVFWVSNMVRDRSGDIKGFQRCDCNWRDENDPPDRTIDNSLRVDSLTDASPLHGWGD